MHRIAILALGIIVQCGCIAGSNNLRNGTPKLDQDGSNVSFDLSIAAWGANDPSEFNSISFVYWTNRDAAPKFGKCVVSKIDKVKSEATVKVPVANMVYYYWVANTARSTYIVDDNGLPWCYVHHNERGK